MGRKIKKVRKTKITTIVLEKPKRQEGNLKTRTNRKTGHGRKENNHTNENQRDEHPDEPQNKTVHRNHKCGFCNEAEEIKEHIIQSCQKLKIALKT